MRRLAHATLNDPRWQQVLARDPRADGRFYYSVRSTGVYCRPSCGARTARPENVAFHATQEEARRAGFRPCKRCQPDHADLADRQAATVTQACRIIEGAARLPALKELADRVGLSPFHFHRLFKAITGLTPRQYALAQRAQRVRAELASGRSVTDAIYQAGYGSNSRFYQESGRVLGMSPGAYRAGGSSNVIRFAIGACSLGSVLVARSERGVCAIFLGDDARALKRDLRDRFPKASLIGDDGGFSDLVARVVRLVEAPSKGLRLPLDIRGTAFQQRVWHALRDIPPGTTVSYGEIARRIGAPAAVRAVARAIGANPLAVAIPCHRVVRSDGTLCGYRWGPKRKRVLLDREAEPGLK